MNLTVTPVEPGDPNLPLGGIKVTDDSGNTGYISNGSTGPQGPQGPQSICLCQCRCGPGA